MLKYIKNINLYSTSFCIIVIISLVFNYKLFSQSKIEIKNLSSEYIYDWGKVSPEKEILHASLPIINTGKDTLIIEQVHPGCSCTKIFLDKYKIPSGDSAILKVQLHTRGFSGNVSKNINILSNDPDYSNLYVFLQAYIEYPLVFSPNQYIIFQNSIKGTKYTQSLEITNTTDTTITILEARSSDSSFSHNIKSNTKIKPKQKLKVTINYSPQNNESLRGGITIKTDSQSYQFYRIFITGLPKM